MEIGRGTNVPINFRDTNLCTLVTFPRSAHLYLAFLGDGCTFFHLYFHGFNSLLRVLWRIKCNLFIQWNSVLYCVNFEVINNGFSQIISHTRGFTVHHCCTGRHPFSLLFSQLFIVLAYWCVVLVDFAVILVLFCPHLDSFTVL